VGKIEGVGVAVGIFDTGGGGVAVTGEAFVGIRNFWPT